ADLVVLANPGLVPAVVTLTLYGSAGETAPPAGQSIVVAAGTQRVIPLAALALGEENPIIRVTAAQAPVQASVQTSLTRVLDPSGVDQVAAIGAPGADIVIPGVPVTLAPGEEVAVRFDVPTSRLAFTGQDGRRIVEPGDIELWVGPSCADRETETSLRIGGPVHALRAEDDRLVAVGVSAVVAG
ncbi:MAG: fibronectin type III-like domain-contianing protein, partial [Microbacterium sp.]|nr:fibronectin type III-like domain-contianing protein [Microbacterium sp.]